MLSSFHAVLALTTSCILPVQAYINYTTVTGYFPQDDPSTNATTFNFMATNFGLINQSYPGISNTSSKTQWQLFEDLVSKLNVKASDNVEYRVLYMGRHGEGYHNAAQTYYGTPAWNCYYSERNGNATVTWADAHLTPVGVSQAKAVNAFWASEIKNQKIPTPQSYYTSPLYRCLQTALYSFAGLDLPAAHPFVPEVKELFRETISGHTCDRRSNKTIIQDSFPNYTTEPFLTDNDELWQALRSETDIDQQIRSRIVLDQIFSTDTSTYISITSHSGEIGAILEVLNHQPFSLNTGAAIPVLVQAETISGAGAVTATMPYSMLATCAIAPTITASACNDCSCCTATAAARRWSD